MTVQGDLSIRNYVDREGQNRTSVQINATHVEFPGKRGTSTAPGTAAATENGDPSDDQLPF